MYPTILNFMEMAFFTNDFAIWCIDNLLDFVAYHPNLALNQVAHQSSKRYGGKKYEAYHAVNGWMSPGPVQSTLMEDNPWLAVDLGHVYKVSSVVVANRIDCCGKL